MIPLKLQIKNFLSYQEPTVCIDFSPFNLIGLAGKNGHGKSAIIDAITWALWGQARKSANSSKPDENLLCSGRSNMIACLEFEVAGQIYKVRREFTKGSSKNLASLEFFVQQNNLGWQNLSEKTIRQTQQVINANTRVDFETFSNSVLLRQGCANEFAKKSPLERKSILTKILNLDKYSSLQELALQKAKTLKLTVNQEEAALLEIKKKLDKESEVNNKLIEFKKKLYDLTKLNLEQRKHEQDCYSKILLLKDFIKQNSNCEDVYKQKQKEHATIIIKKQAWEKKLACFAKILNLKVDIEKASQIYKKLETSLDVSQRELALKQKLEINLFQKEKEKMIFLNKQERLLQNNISLLEKQQSTLETEIVRLKGRVDKFSKLVNSDVKECPYCEQRLAGELVVCKIKVKTERELEGKKRELKCLIEKITKQQAAHSLFLEQDQAFCKLKAEIHQLKEKVNSFVIDLDKIDAIKIEIAKQKELAMLEKDLLQSEQSISFANEAIAELKGQEEKVCLDLSELEKLVSSIFEKKKNLKQLEDELFGIKSGLQKDEFEIAQLNKYVGKCEQFLEDLFKDKSKIKDIERKIYKLSQEVNNYSHVALAFGKNGIQALLIETIIPEIEAQANRILAKITINKTQIFLHSQKELKKGGARESLDIKISDGSGLREYEMFSGGEAFRIDFALRIGISKVIAQKAGAALDCLIIDEGFGSLDEEGINLFTDCLYKVCKDFSKVIVVSHLNSIKNMFPVLFKIQKSKLGSKIQIETQG